jgi:hypothetical protein
MWIKILPPIFKAQLWYALLDRFVHLHGKVELYMTCMLTSGSPMRSSVIKLRFSIFLHTHFLPPYSFMKVYDPFTLHHTFVSTIHTELHTQSHIRKITLIHAHIRLLLLLTYTQSHDYT